MRVRFSLAKATPFQCLQPLLFRYSLQERYRIIIPVILLTGYRLRA